MLDKLAVARGDQVAAGATLFVLEHGAEQAAVDAAAARIRNAEARLENLGEGRRAAELDVIRAQADSAATALRLSRLQLDQTDSCSSRRFVSQAKLDEAKAARRPRRGAAWPRREAALQVGLQSLGRKPEIQAARAEIEAAQADLAQAKVRLDQKTGVRADRGARLRHVFPRRRVGAGRRPGREPAAAGQRQGPLLRARDDGRLAAPGAGGDARLRRLRRADRPPRSRSSRRRPSTRRR